MKKPLLLLLPFLLLVSSPASVMRLDAAFSGTAVDLNGSGHSYTLAGSYAFLFDNALIPESGAFTLSDQTLTTLSLNPSNVGATIYDTANTYLTLRFSNGTVTSLALDDRGHDGVGTGRDDFLVFMFGPGSFSGGGMFYSLASEPDFLGYATNLTGSYSVTAVSVPETTSTGWLVALAVLGLVTTARAKRLRA